MTTLQRPKDVNRWPSYTDHIHTWARFTPQESTGGDSESFIHRMADNAQGRFDALMSAPCHSVLIDYLRSWRETPTDNTFDDSTPPHGARPPHWMAQEVDEAMLNMKNHIPLLAWMPKLPCAAETVESCSFSNWGEGRKALHTGINHNIREFSTATPEQMGREITIQRLLLRINHQLWHGEPSEKSEPEIHKHTLSDKWPDCQASGVLRQLKDAGVFVTSNRKVSRLAVRLTKKDFNDSITDVFLSPTFHRVCDDLRHSWDDRDVIQYFDLPEHVTVHRDLMLSTDTHEHVVFLNQSSLSNGIGSTIMLRVFWPLDYITVGKTDDKKTIEQGWFTDTTPQMLSPSNSLAFAFAKD